MKVGDLVTLSSYACNLDSTPRKFKPWYRGSKAIKYVEPVVIVCEIRDVPHSEHLSENESKKFYVKWATDGPPGRHHYTKYFYRKDLKYVR